MKENLVIVLLNFIFKAMEVAMATYLVDIVYSTILIEKFNTLPPFTFGEIFMTLVAILCFKEFILGNYLRVLPK